jgi:PAS domain S-box-containing protein
VDKQKGEPPVNASVGLDWTTRSAPAQVLWLAPPALLLATIFFFDFRASDRMIFGLPYLLAVALAEVTIGGVAATITASVAAVLVLVAPLVGTSPASLEAGWLVLFGRTTVAASIGMMVLFLRQRDAARETIRVQADAVAENSTHTNQRSDELRLMNAQLHREIAERRRAELRSGYLASIVESSADAIIGQSLDGTIVSWNAGAARMYGRERGEVIGQPASTLFPHEQQDEVTQLLKRVAKGQRVDEVESERLRHDGTRFDVSASFSPILDDRGAIIGVSMIERDITRRMRAEQALQSLNAELEEKVRQRTEDLESAVGELEAFSYSVSHDLRAPLRALNGFAESLVEDAAERLNDEERRMLGRIQRSAGRMDRIIEDLLMLSRAGNHRIEKEVVNLGDLARSVIEELGSSAPERKVEWDIGNGLLAWGDPGLLRLVVQNLVGNAFKYTAHKPSARIAIGVDERAGDTVTYFVRDDGAGFDPSLADKLFRPFSRLHASDEFEGSGIGLATVERIVRRHGGSVSADSVKGEGATFRFRLPVPKRTRSSSDAEVGFGEHDDPVPGTLI